MNSHLNVVFITYRHDSLKEINDVLKELILIDSLVKLKELFYLSHSFRFPARHNCAVHLT